MFITWLALVFILFAIFFGNKVQIFDQKGIATDSKHWAQKDRQIAKLLSQIASQQLTEGEFKSDTILHIVDPDCACSRFSIPYIQDLLSDSKLAKYQQFVLTPPTQKIDDINTSLTLTKQQYQQLSQLVPATPAALVWSHSHQAVAFIGAHSGGFLCGSGSSNLEPVDFSLSQGVNPKFFPFEQRGCFCPS